MQVKCQVTILIMSAFFCMLFLFRQRKNCRDIVDVIDLIVGFVPGVPELQPLEHW